MKFWQIIKNAILVSVGHPLTSLSLIVVNAGIFYFSLVKYSFLILFFMGSFMAIFSFWTFFRIYNRMKEKQEKLMEKENEKKQGLSEHKEADQEDDSTQEIAEERSEPALTEGAASSHLNEAESSGNTSTSKPKHET